MKTNTADKDKICNSLCSQWLDESVIQGEFSLMFVVAIFHPHWKDIFVYYSLNNFFLPLSCFAHYLLSVSQQVYHIVQHAFIFFSLVPFKGVQENVMDFDDHIFGAVYRILLVWELHLHLQFVFSKHSFGTESMWCYATPFPLWVFCSLSFEDALNSHGISGIISLFFLRDNICILVQ